MYKDIANVVEQHLTDGSSAYNVYLFSDHLDTRRVIAVLAACHQRGATAIAEALNSYLAYTDIK